MTPNVQIFCGRLAVDLSAMRLVKLLPKEHEAVPGHVVGALIIFHDDTRRFARKADDELLVSALQESSAAVRKERRTMKVFADLVIDPENVWVVAITQDMRGGGFTSMCENANLIMESGERVNISPEAARKLIEHFKA